MKVFIISAGNKWRTRRVLAKYVIDQGEGGETEGPCEPGREVEGAKESEGWRVGGCR